ncbi:LOW QUALITY PROTEIN: hypothetical protein IFM46972_05757 [Aspergillus udagawae]|uniref:Uncharacterized protein n=1 Tax=Aspergillus udagawae TaxID=91492 RepID=A0A8H3NSM7_9EURO|nr:LOW QUALITY PROTEIN: hypothetical protein IFM46972_05757 [Aspergillus udagawae]
MGFSSVKYAHTQPSQFHQGKKPRSSTYRTRKWQIYEQWLRTSRTSYLRRTSLQIPNDCIIPALLEQ